MGHSSLLNVCVHVEQAGQQVHNIELAALFQLVSISAGSKFSLCIRGGIPTLLRVLSDNSEDGRQFAFCRDFTSELFLRCYYRQGCSSRCVQDLST